MMKLVGDKSSFALECVVSLNNFNMGRIFIYINGIKFGQDDYDEELDAFFFRSIKSIKSMNNDFPELFSLSAEDFVQLTDCIYEDFSSPCCNVFDKYINQSSEIDWNTILRAEYAFDSVLIGCVSKDDKEKIFLHKDDVFLEKIMEKGGFENYFLQLASNVLPAFDWYAITCDTKELIVKGVNDQ